MLSWMFEVGAVSGTSNTCASVWFFSFFLFFSRHADSKQALNGLNTNYKKARWLLLPVTLHQAGAASHLPQGRWPMSPLIHHSSPALHSHTITEGREASLPSFLPSFRSALLICFLLNPSSKKCFCNCSFSPPIIPS